MEPTDVRNLRANLSISEGAKCAVCGGQFRLAEDIVQCLSCEAYYHPACWAQTGSCTNPGCRVEEAPKAADQAASWQAPAPEPEPAQQSQPFVSGWPQEQPSVPQPQQSYASEPSSPSDTRPCPFCGQPIKVDAMKCRHCGRILDASLQQSLAPPEDPGNWWDKQAAPYKDGSFAIWFHVLCCQCPGIVIAVLFLMFCRTERGKENGKRLLTYSAVGLVVSILIRILIIAGSTGGR